MKRRTTFAAWAVAACVIAVSSLTARAEDAKKVRLFILSGQSNMAGLDPDISFTPTVKAAFPDDEVIVVKSAQGGQPIRRWYEEWNPGPGKKASGGGNSNGDLYDRLMRAVRSAVGDKKPETIAFVWMQGERDARELHGDVYAASLKGLIEQLRGDLGRRDVVAVIGRLSDFSNGNDRYGNWDEVRAAQVEVAEADPLAGWIDTDDLNGPNDGLHYGKGYVELGKRFAEKAIELIESLKK